MDYSQVDMLGARYQSVDFGLEQSPRPGPTKLVGPVKLVKYLLSTSGVEGRVEESWGAAVHRNVQRFRGGLVFKAHRRCVSLNSRLAVNQKVP